MLFNVYVCCTCTLLHTWWAQTSQFAVDQSIIKPQCQKPSIVTERSCVPRVLVQQRLVSFHFLLCLATIRGETFCNTMTQLRRWLSDRGRAGNRPFEKSFEPPPRYLSSVSFSSRTEPCEKTLGTGICRRYLISFLFLLLPAFMLIVFAFSSCVSGTGVAR